MMFGILTCLVCVNIDKTAVVVFRTSKMSHVEITLLYAGEQVRQRSVHRHLGLHLDDRLWWTDHINAVTRKVFCKLGLLFRLRRRLSGPILRDLYLTCVLPSLEYGSLSWCGLSRSNF